MDRLLREDELIRWIGRRLGAPTLKVPLTDEQYGDAIAEAKRWFVAKKGIEKDTVIDIYSGQTEYDVPADCDAVIDVSLQVSPFDFSLVFAPQILADERIPYSVFAAPSSVGLYSSFIQSMQYVEMAKRVMGAEPGWVYFAYKKKLLIFPAQTNTGKAIIEYKSNGVGTIEQLPERDHDLIKRFALAFAKRDLGQMYSKYATMPTAEGQTQLNGPQLLQQAETEFQKLETEISQSALPMPILTG